MIALHLTEQEAVALRNLLNIAVQAGGMQAAEIALPIDTKIRKAGTRFEDEQAWVRHMEASGKETDNGNA